MTDRILTQLDPADYPGNFYFYLIILNNDLLELRNLHNANFIRKWWNNYEKLDFVWWRYGQVNSGKETDLKKHLKYIETYNPHDFVLKCVIKFSNQQDLDKFVSFFRSSYIKRFQIISTHSNWLKLKDSEREKFAGKNLETEANKYNCEIFSETQLNILKNSISELEE